MRARDILSKNVRALIEDARESRPELGTIKKVADISGGHLTNGTVGRMATGESPVNIDAVGDLARVFGLEPWQLLVENLNPKALPRLADSSLLSQIKAMVDSAKVQNAEDSSSPKAEQPLQLSERDRQVPIGPALTEVLGEDKNARRRTASASKPKGRRRS
jgi:hypothetical protein